MGSKLRKILPSDGLDGKSTQLTLVVGVEEKEAEEHFHFAERDGNSHNLDINIEEFLMRHPEPESVDAYFEDEPDNCEIYFAGAGTNFRSFSITQEEKDEHLTYE